jgi:hypothetical protein
MTLQEECTDAYSVYIVSAYAENIQASAWGEGVKAGRLNNIGRTRVAAGDALNFWAFMGKPARGEIKTDEELIERAMQTSTVFLLFRQPRGLGNRKPKTLGMAKVLKPRGDPYQQPYKDWPRKVGSNGKARGPWMDTTPFPVEWYFTSDLDDKELGLERTNLPAYLTRQEPGSVPGVMRKLYAECRSHQSDWKRDGKLKIVGRNMRSFETEARRFHFAPKDVWEGKEKLHVKPAPIAVD